MNKIQTKVVSLSQQVVQMTKEIDALVNEISIDRKNQKEVTQKVIKVQAIVKQMKEVNKELSIASNKLSSKKSYLLFAPMVGFFDIFVK